MNRMLMLYREWYLSAPDFDADRRWSTIGRGAPGPWEHSDPAEDPVAGDCEQV